MTELVERLHASLDEAREVPLPSMGPAAKRRALVRLATARAKFDALALRLLADAEATDACTETGAATAASWLAVETRQTRLATRSDLTLAIRLEPLPRLSAGMVSGAVNTAQARAIVAVLDQLPRRGEFAVSAEQLAEAEAHLVDWPRPTTPSS